MHGIVVGGGGTILTTTDGGATWTARPSGTTVTLIAVSFPDLMHGTAVGSSGTILTTADAGEGGVCALRVRTRQIEGRLTFL